MNTAFFLERNEVIWADKPFLTYKGKTHTFSGFALDVKAAARFLCNRVGRDSTIAIYAENSYEWTVLYTAMLAYTGVCMPIDKEWVGHDLKNTLGFIKPDAVIYSAETAERAVKISESFSDIKFISIDEVFESGERYEDTELIPRTDKDKTAMIFFSSGTTGSPKAIPLTQGNMFNNVDILMKRTPMSNDDLSVMFLPLAHVYSGISNFLYSLVSGMRIYICEDIHNCVADMMRLRPTAVCMVPVILKKMHDSMTDELMDMLKNVRWLYSGGSGLDSELKKWYRDNGIMLLDTYGSTETSAIVATDIPGETECGCCGTVFEGLEVKIASPDDEGCGEILVKGGSVTKGYLGRTDNEKYFDSEGFFHTGDLGRLDEKNRLYIKGRIKRMLDMPNGKNVYADELEELISSITEAQKVTVGLENGEICARIFTNKTEDEMAALMEQVNTRLPRFKQIRRYNVCKMTGSKLK